MRIIVDCGIVGLSCPLNLPTCDDLLAMGKTPREITGEAIGNRLRELNLKPGSLTYRYRYCDSWMGERDRAIQATSEYI